jgi:hypothetical protein
MMFDVPMVVRGQIIAEDWVTFGGRSAGVQFRAPDPSIHIDALPLPDHGSMAELYELSFDDIVGYLQKLGTALNPDENEHIQRAHEIGLITSGLTPSVLEQNFRALPLWFDPAFIREMVDSSVGVDVLEGWVEQKLVDGRIQRVRAFGSRAVHIVAGNSPVLSAVSVIRNAVTRSDAIIKTPSNDPLTAVAIAQTMAEMAPEHPLTRHLSAAYWKGGDTEVEARLYEPRHVEKIVAWGGFASVKHVTRYLQPGLEMIALDPKRSSSIIGPEAFDSEAIMREVAQRLACDVGTLNQEGCACARVVYVQSGTDAKGIAQLDRLGQMVYDAILELPEEFSTKPLRYDPELRSYLDAQRLDDDWYSVFGGRDGEGAVIVSHLDEPVDYSPILSGRTTNLVPIDDISRAIEAVNAYTQTIGIYPEALKESLREQLPLFGAQRMVSLGYACSVSLAGPQDAIEPLGRMCKWIIDESADPSTVYPMWQRPVR